MNILLTVLARKRMISSGENDFRKEAKKPEIDHVFTEMRR